ncbi:VWA domain-containing protein [Thalassotalea atypica]|uniref:VWA domain-containing protein n=1 Tax=Thalassotalea atypica TaxID=2054316 RepID=UPI00257464E9|nr:VWA domain-containing protein [Thalassotalea atypica]
MFEFVYPGWFLVFPLPYLIYKFVPAYQTRRSAVKVPFFGKLLELIDEKPQEGAECLEPSTWQKIAMILAWTAVLTALAKPMWLGPVQQREMIGRDVMVVVDLSGSMETEDFMLSNGAMGSRLSAIKEVLTDFSQDREGDRLGLILFGDSAYLQAPFTADHQAWLELLNETEVAMAGQSTHLGDAIGLAIKIFNQPNQTNPNKEKVAIVFTDGNDTDSLVPPIDAAKVAAAKDIRIHMVAIGDPQTVGEQAMDMEVIEKVASLTTGQSFIALSPTELQRVNQTISELEQQTYSSVNFQPKMSMHYVPILFLLFLYLLGFYSAMFRRQYQSKAVRQKARSVASNSKGAK